MGTDTAAAGKTGRAVDAATLAEAFRLTSAQRASDGAVRTLDGETDWTWGELREKVDALAAGLHGLGLRKGETIALLLGNRPEFHLADIAAMMVGATPFSIYMTYAPGQIAYVVGDAGARIIITEQQFLANVLKAREELPELEHVIVVDGDPPDGAIGLDDAVAAADGSFDLEASVAALGPEDVLTLIYTSGTTGPPKGVQLSHRNLLAAVQQVEDLIVLPKDGR
jgi:long-chain acyl-CoA synthetase